MITLTIRKLTLTIIILTLRSDNIENKKFIETHLKFQNSVFQQELSKKSF